jgi:hypothetical protein
VESVDELEDLGSGVLGADSDVVHAAVEADRQKLIRRFGARKMWLHLRSRGHDVARCTLERLYAEQGWAGALRAKKYRTTIPAAEHQRPADLVERDFTATAPNQLWVADFTYVATFSGTVYVAFVFDVFSRLIEAGVDASLGSVGDAYALADPAVGLGVVVTCSAARCRQSDESKASSALSTSSRAERNRPSCVVLPWRLPDECLGS